MKKVTATPAPWLSSIPRYPFIALREKKEALRKKGVEVIDFSIGDPTAPTPDFIIEAASSAMKELRSAGYPENRGSLDFRKAVVSWMRRRFAVTLDPDRELFPSLGAKEAVFAFPGCVTGGGVLVPTPGYPPYYSGALAAGKRVHLVPLLEEKGFLPDLSSISTDAAKDAKIIWVNYPNNPTTVLATRKFYNELLEFARDFNIIIASDECYTEMYHDEAPESLLQYGKEGIIVFQSLSKRSNMTGWRVGFMAGDAELIRLFLLAKENMDSGCATFVQKAAAAALADDDHVAAMREEYREKRNILKAALKEMGLREGYSGGTFYLWQPIPEGIRSAEFAARLLEEDVAVVVTPGPALAVPLPDGTNPGEGFVRFALVPPIESTKTAAARLVKACKTLVRK
ncbi:MAG: aminotransferase class I/II-fold pyridoxal phosphate-dependent enzyme [Candidatus Eremiobacteraeota bacterium]|nr:aminotransferase class I/II-fold pyridoxal phosphate-dependent enzyme [Candidatus Eremiobacteraeota bacterium]